MFNVKYKQRHKTDALHSFIEKNTSKQYDPSVTTMSLGITTAVLYLLTFLYMYIGAIKQLTNGWQPITMSFAFEKTNKVIPTIMILIISALMQFYFKEQNIYEFSSKNNTERILLLVFLYSIPLSWLLLFLVFTDLKVGHVFVAFISLVSTTCMIFIIYQLYSADYEGDGLLPIKICTYISITIAILLTLFAIFVYMWQNNVFFRNIFCLLEVLNVVIFFIFIIICSTFPPLIKQNNITCYV